MKKCPRCELNYIQDNEDLCEVCRTELGGKDTQIHNRRDNIYFNEDFTFTGEQKCLEGEHGFACYNSKQEEVGVVYKQTDTRTPACGNCEIVFYEKYRGKYGKYHRFTSHGQRLAWNILIYSLTQNDRVTYHID